MQGGVKRGREEYERRGKDTEEPEEPAAPIPGAEVCRSLALDALSTLTMMACMRCPVEENGSQTMYRRGSMLPFSLP